MPPTKYGPKSRSSPSIGSPCPLCNVVFAAGDYTALVAKTRDGRYANDAVEAHWDCIAKGTGEREVAFLRARKRDATFGSIPTSLSGR
jgi:hypothetical protein